ncbi:hypothetical protein [uncultured Psychroserpens sp.]|uniref:hypothetical protein n=1 Tax=uncultured Psychroserpens sp. TaxID=255436 RepID=UPI0026056E17|nr:hypothetical protein [uncultured Psychroserpens sp.]
MKNYTITVDKKHLEDTLTHWSSLSSHTKQIVENIKNEHFLEASAMNDILTEIVNNKDDLTLLEKKLTDFVRANSLRKGDVIKRDCPNKLGTVMPLSSFKRHLDSYYPDRFITYTIDDFLTALKANKIRSKDKDLMIKAPNRSIWFTWNENECRADPFSFMETEFAEEARLALGLGYNDYKTTNFIAFIFKTDLKKTLYRPTFADSDLSEFFRPTELKFKNYGKTYILNEGKFRTKTVDYKIENVSYLPEAINVSQLFKIEDLEYVKILHAIK